MSSIELLNIVTPDLTSVSPVEGKFARFRKNEKTLTSGQGSGESALGTALSALAARSQNQNNSERPLRGVRFHLTRNEACEAECNDLHPAHQKLLVRLYWRGVGSVAPSALHEWTLENSRIRGRLAAFNRNEIRLNLQVEVPSGSLLEVRVIDACSNETDLRGKVADCQSGSNGEWLVRCKLLTPLTQNQILELCGAP